MAGTRSMARCMCNTILCMISYLNGIHRMSMIVAQKGRGETLLNSSVSPAFDGGLFAVARDPHGEATFATS